MPRLLGIASAALLLSLFSLVTAQLFDFSLCELGPAGIIVGRTVSLTGIYSAESLEAKQGHDFWLDYQNNILGGVMFNGTRCRFTIETWNDASDLTLVSRLYEDMVIPTVNRTTVDVLFSPYGTVLTSPAIAVAKSHRVPIVFHSASDPSLFTVNPSGPISFGMLVRSSKRSQVCIDALTKNVTRTPPIITAALINFNDTFQNTAIRNAITQLQANSINIAWNLTVPGDQTDFSEIMANLTAQPVDLLVLGFVASTGEPFLQQLRKADINPKAVYLTSSGTLASLLLSLEFEADFAFAGDQWQPALPYTDPSFGNATNWAAEYQKRFGTVATLFSAAAFAAGVTVAGAISRAQSVDHEILASALAATNLSASFFGPISFSAGGEPALSAICAQSIDKYLEVVSPNLLATTPLVYPAVPVYPPKPKDNTAARNRLIIGLSVGLGLLVIAAIIAAVIVLRARYHLVFLSRDVKAETDTWG